MEKLSLVNRFWPFYLLREAEQGRVQRDGSGSRDAGITPEQVQTERRFCYEANRFEMRGGGLSDRTAQQFANYLLTIK